ncbi:hypothetical protein Clacol_008898 [Clathrus columnatus]|uniref:CinA C-terminal domain-containing protein n=1 Tax=Clathrus columnatus TaxID=1419009 RepID=A0AAV5ALJ1_9AGAM|nr:hypothetical protein Clacol_008898 [Clathrus columnatus]
MSTFPPQPIRPILSSIAAILRERNQTVSVIETATGGLISACLLATPGASAYYRGGLTLYSLESRITFAGWTQEDINTYKGPTPQVVSKLAKRIQSQFSTTYTICESGTAGPTTRNFTSPGYVALAIASDSGEVTTREVSTGSSDRESNMVAFTEAALNLFLDVLNKSVQV